MATLTTTTAGGMMMMPPPHTMTTMTPLRSSTNNNANNAATTTTSAPVIASSEGPVQLHPNPDNHQHQQSYHAVPRQHRFSPYDFNGGTVAAVAGHDYAVVASDTRLSSGYEILSRNVPKLHQLTSKCVLASAGCKTDVDQLRSVLDIKMKVSIVVVIIVMFTLINK